MSHFYHITDKIDTSEESMSKLFPISNNYTNENDVSEKIIVELKTESYIDSIKELTYDDFCKTIKFFDLETQLEIKKNEDDDFEYKDEELMSLLMYWNGFLLTYIKPGYNNINVLSIEDKRKYTLKEFDL